MQCSKPNCTNPITFKHNWCKQCHTTHRQIPSIKDSLNKKARERNSQHYTYCIINLLTGKRYYGSTSQKYRWYYHKRFATHRYDKRYDKPFYVELRTVGIENFRFTILKYYESKEQARKAEALLILTDSDSYNTYRPWTYELCAEEASKYDTSSDWKSASSSSWNHARKKGWLEKILSEKNLEI